MAEILLARLKKVCNHSIEVDWNFLSRMGKHGATHSIGNITPLEDLDNFLEKLMWYKSPRKNLFSPNAAKVLELHLRIKLLNFTNE